jgi:arginine exporter protein ArgO
MQQIVQLFIHILGVVFLIFHCIRFANQAWIQSKQMQECSHVEIQLEQLLYLQSIHGNPLCLVIQENL